MSGLSHWPPVARHVRGAGGFFTVAKAADAKIRETGVDPKSETGDNSVTRHEALSLN